MSIIQRAGEGRGGFFLERAIMSPSRHPSWSYSKAGRLFGRHPLSLQSWLMKVIAEEVVWKASLVSTELVDEGDCRGGCLEGIPCLYGVG